MDNDGVDEPDDEEYMDNKDKAIKKAMKKEGKRLRDITNPIIGIGAINNPFEK